MKRTDFQDAIEFAIEASQAPSSAAAELRAFAATAQRAATLTWGVSTREGSVIGCPLTECPMRGFEGDFVFATAYDAHMADYLGERRPQVVEIEP